MKFSLGERFMALTLITVIWQKSIFLKIKYLQSEILLFLTLYFCYFLIVISTIFKKGATINE